MSWIFVICYPVDFTEPENVNRPGIPCYSSGDFLNLTPKLMEKMFKDLRAGTTLHHHLFAKLAMDLGRIVQHDSSRVFIDLTQESSEEASEELQHGYSRLITSDFIDLVPESTGKSGEDLEFGIQHYMSSDFAKRSGGG